MAFSQPFPHTGQLTPGRWAAAVMEVVGQHFRPEFINHVDDMVVFHPLSREAIRQIAYIQLGHLLKRLAGNELDLEVSKEALDLPGIHSGRSTGVAPPSP